MAGRPDAARSRAVGRYNLVLEMAKSQLGALWAGSIQGSPGPEPRTLRRLALGTGVSQATHEALLAAAHWGTHFASEYAADTLDVVDSKNELTLVTGYVPGETLKALLRLANFKRQSIPARVALRIALDACEALCAAELRTASAPQGPDFLWGGLLPDSIVVGTDGTSRLLDIGVAAIWQREVPAAQHPEVTSYLAPEQLEHSSVDSRADVFSVGTLLWEMLSGGKRLFVGSSHRAVADKLKQHYVPPLSLTGVLDVDATALQALVSKMLEQDPRRRFRSVDDLRNALRSMEDAVALPMEVSDFVTTFASNSLASRQRVLERALRRSAPVRPARPAAAAAPAVAGPTNAPTLQEIGGADALERAARTSSPSVQRPSSPPPAAMRPRADSPPRGAGARPLPLPAQAKLGHRISAPDNLLPPPPVASPVKRPSLPDPPVAEGDAAASVRAEDILAALAVEEDLGPGSDEMPTLRPAEPDAEPPAPAVAANPPAPRPVQRTLPGPGDMANLPPLARPPLETIPGVAPPEQPAAASVARAADAAPRASSPPPTATPHLGQPHPTAGSAHESAAQAAVAVASPSGGGEQPLSTAEADGVTRKPRPETARLPTLLLAALAGGALLLLLGLGLALSGGNDAAPEVREADNASAPKRTVGSTLADTKATDTKSNPATPDELVAAEATTNDSEPSDKSTDGEEQKQTSATAEDETATNETATAAAPPSPALTTRPTPRQAPAPTPRRAAAPKRKKIRATRSFIPSGI